MPVDLLVRNARQLVSLAGPAAPRAGLLQSELSIIEDGAVAVSEGRIVAVGSTEELLRKLPLDGRTIQIDAAGLVVTPGLVDSHTHLVFAGTRVAEFDLRAQGATYGQILAAGGGIYDTVRRTRAADAAQLLATARRHLGSMARFGTTALEAKSGYGLDLETECRQLAVLMELDGQPLDIAPTFLGAHAVPSGADPESYVEWLCEAAIPEVARRGLARFCDVFCEAGVFTPEQSERILRTGMAHSLRPRVHADELHDTGGASLAARVGAISADHLHCASEVGLVQMAAAGVIAVLLPGTAVFLGLKTQAPARRMIELGVPLALGTDFNPGSCYCESLALVMSFAVSQCRLTAAEALVAATINGAYAVGLGERLGSLEVGKQADLVIWDADDYRLIPYHMGTSLVRTVLKRGQILYSSNGSSPCPS
ncbi:imidazolonepropionase [Gloeobacter kilaueensis]|uniref:Imidazolonepropionase n=1 Tax=Gloeobacter kilaueensis (strain ATCC BAA-2537 / CCAP 1431/1 / ULC 316 / JS1) TaxID=1183438 RepID=U5QNL7_GLOK1|nr:imidazolonepropionase [Gloeobacter kilaueensis]AGY60468.1 imidazolonepropionase [Gloeobacter kilaueensis JS1]